MQTIRLLKRSILSAVTIVAVASLMPLQAAFASTGDAVLWWTSASKTLFSTSVEVMSTNPLSGPQTVLAKVIAVNTSSSTRDVECQISLNGPSDNGRATLPPGSTSAPTRSTITMQIVATPAQSGTDAQAHLYCWVNGTSSGVTAQWIKITTEQLHAGTNIAVP